MTLNRILPEELNEKLKNKEKVFILDVRAEEKYKNFHIEDSSIKSIHIEKTDIFNLDENQQDAINSLPKKKEIIVTCTTGNSAAKCAVILSERGYDVAVLEGGLTAWKKFKEEAVD
ncbi:rhodanese-like domain-containing protein [Bacillus sp. M6-12]|uniref:rhodanese-like domain-containing protein n=1 Tax=Bacillus sp. M6-12 TaxID=2054166 RepID=UPI000C75E2EA|nr:rhodanese-like domain-containing protein [Bacillus sp. M6-12]PLS14747.1 rhodanese-like domain-containing protein [Bacillus sp. M6-12]